LSIGGNDAAFIPTQQTFRVPTERFKDNLIHLIAIARTHTPHAFVQTLMPVNDAVTIEQPGRDRSKSNVHVQQYNACLREVCTEQEVSIIDTHSAFMQNNHLTLLCDDGVHPNAQGHQRIAELVHAAIVQALPHPKNSPS
jgi:lysophospholipase L1-like esterase